MADAGRMQAVWNARVGTWHDHVSTSPAFERIRAELLAEAAPRATDRAIDLGAGTGFITLELAPQVRSVIAVDVSEEMLVQLECSAHASSVANVHAVVADLAKIDLPTGSVDLVVSNYALHHLDDVGKRVLLTRVARWLRPGGRVVVADMMFGRGRTARDRQIIVGKARTLLRKGPAGAYRVVKNIVRFGLRQGTERPASPEFWLRTLADAGFRDAAYRPLIAEAGLVVGRAPGR